ncbi:MAG: DUF1697 domain-containing protein [Allosphingosinicella sp.]
MGGYVALLRGVNVGGHRKVPMAALRDLAAALGLENPRTYVASGNLVFESGGSGAELEAMLERALEARFGFEVDVIVRSAAQWAGYRQGNPFPQESADTPNLVMIALGKQAPRQADVQALRAQAGPQERVEQVGDAIWIWFGGGAGRSKIGTGPARGVSTTRNWRTVVALDGMVNG